MPIRYTERLNIPADPVEEVHFSTPNGLPLATGYKAVVFTDKGPMIEFYADQIIFTNIHTPTALLWRRKHPEAFYVEFRSKDYCSVKIFEQKRDMDMLKKGMWYISPFNMISDKHPVLIERLQKTKK